MLSAIVSLDTLQLPAGPVIRVPATWQGDRQLGDSSILRLKYRPGELLLMSPLPQHGRDANLLADLIKLLLDYTAQDDDAFTPLTL
jgi:Uma2 family endonuclease